MLSALRLSRVMVHLLWAAVSIRCCFPLLPVKLRRSLKVRWSRQLLDMLGVRLQCTGAPATDGLLVSNHVSWLDIYAINALTATSFVAKDEVRRWPLIGWLSAQTETIYLQRGSRAAAMRTKQALVDKLRSRSCIALFPEGTTSAGNGVLPFHSALFQSAIDAGVEVIPLALRYTGPDGKPAAAPVYIGETSLWQSLLAIVGAAGLTVHVDVLPALDPAGGNRRQLAEHAHALISRCLTHWLEAAPTVNDLRYLSRHAVALRNDGALSDRVRRGIA